MQAQPAFRDDRILVKPKVANIGALHAQIGTSVLRSYPHIGNIQVVELPQGVTVAEAIDDFENSGLVKYAEPDYIIQATQTHPNDTHYANGRLWGLHNTGQDGGTADADIDAPEGWDHRTSASNV
ncbi:MAG TPA: hypothetical protein VMS21_07690, partial [Methylomirabilota bacterium]|nr:hypothetical protein [Methylomirabilota bacterium]